MPEHRVAKQLPKEVGDFDLVILHEAAQSDITPLGALARGARLLIVGDDEQVSPVSIGVTADKIAELRTRYLGDLAHRNMIDAGTSISDIAQMMFSEAQVMLREHLRSVAPIIAFSSRFYQDGLVPLRFPKPSERLDSPLIDIYLPEARREKGRNVDPHEAAAIVGEIAAIVADPAMAGRSIGVISLIGRHQVIAHFHEPMPDGAKVVDVALIDRCQSGFEREICTRLLEAGYRVIPQIRAGAFSIDLVVQGPDDRRLAIELDGDRYHGPERWEADMAREAALERAGWVFWRVFGSQWKADPDLWWRRLVARLDKLGIPPIGKSW